jgi:phage portal protein BeeE
MTAVDAQLIDQLKLSAEQVCGVFHVPPYKVNVGAPPLNNNVQSLNVEYYSQCLQKHFEDIELCLDEGLGIGEGVGTPPYLGTEFDLDNLLRMDTEGQMRALKDGAGILKPDEARARIGLGKVPGGDSPYLQHQDYSLAALAKRDALPNPFDPVTQPAPPIPTISPTSSKDMDEDEIELYSFALGTKTLGIHGIQNMSVMRDREAAI